MVWSQVICRLDVFVKLRDNEHVETEADLYSDKDGEPAVKDFSICQTGTCMDAEQGPGQSVITSHDKPASCAPWARILDPPVLQAEISARAGLQQHHLIAL